MAVELRLLGDIQAEVDGRSVDLGHARQRCVLAALAVDVNRTVPVDQLLDRVWADRLPQRARNTLSGYVSRLRRAFASTGEVAITRQPGGYVLAADPMMVDLHRFQSLLARARASGDADLLDQALALWRGTAFSTLDTPWLNAVRDALDAERLAAELDRTDHALARGRHAAVLGMLSTLTADHPLDERIAGQHMLALYRCGRQADALRSYEQIRSRLADELGADPGAPLQRLHRQLLTADPLVLPPPGRDLPVPRQLPAMPRSFTGRVRELAALDAATGVAVLTGAPGVGKTTLAVQWAHRAADRFPDGQLYVDLRGYDPSGAAMRPADAIGTFLDALHIATQQVPDSFDAQVGLYRSLLAGRRVLVLLDNARSAEQVRPLLPGTPGCLAVVTSRDQFTGLLAVEGAHLLTVDLLPEADAVALLAERLGRQRVEAEPKTVARLVRRCAGLPLALAVVAAHAAAKPTFPLAALTAEPGHQGALGDGAPDTDVYAVFSWSYRTLGTDAARMFRLLGLCPGPDIAAAAAASLAGTPLPRARPALAELTRAHLVNEPSPGRYAVHDLLAAYAADLATKHDAEPDRRGAVRRLLDHYLHTAHAAAARLSPYCESIELAQPRRGVTLGAVANYRRALEWFTTEHTALLAALDLAARAGLDAHTWQLAWALAGYLDRRGLGYLWAGLQSTALASVQRLPDPAEQAHALRSLALASAQMGCYDDVDTLLRQAHALGCLAAGSAQVDYYDDVEAMLRQAIDRFVELADPAEQAHAYLQLGLVSERRGHHRDALRHIQRALELYRTAGHQLGQARALNGIGWLHAQLGQHQEAVESCEHAIRLHQEHGHRSGEAHTWDSLGFTYHRMGYPDHAHACYQQALDLFRELGDRRMEAHTLTQLGNLHPEASVARARAS